MRMDACLTLDVFSERVVDYTLRYSFFLIQVEVFISEAYCLNSNKVLYFGRQISTFIDSFLQTLEFLVLYVVKFEARVNYVLVVSFSFNFSYFFFYLSVFLIVFIAVFVVFKSEIFNKSATFLGLFKID